MKEITEALIGSPIKKLEEKFDYLDDEVSCLETQLAELKSYIGRNEIKTLINDSQKILQEQVDQVQQQAKRNKVRLIGMLEDHGEELNNKIKKL